MAIKADIYFQVFQDGKRVDSVHKTTMQNNVQLLQDALVAQVKQAYPELTADDITMSKQEFQKGYWYIEASTSTHDFVLLISHIE